LFWLNEWISLIDGEDDIMKTATQVDFSVRTQNTVYIILGGTKNDHSLKDKSYSSIPSAFF